MADLEKFANDLQSECAVLSVAYRDAKMAHLATLGAFNTTRTALADFMTKYGAVLRALDNTKGDA